MNKKYFAVDFLDGGLEEGCTFHLLCCLELQQLEYGFIIRWVSEENHYKSVFIRNSEKPSSDIMNGGYKEIYPSQQWQ